jgi:hypothetical protein
MAPACLNGGLALCSGWAFWGRLGRGLLASLPWPKHSKALKSLDGNLIVFNYNFRIKNSQAPGFIKLL